LTAAATKNEIATSEIELPRPRIADRNHFPRVKNGVLRVGLYRFCHDVRRISGIVFDHLPYAKEKIDFTGLQSGYGSGAGSGTPLR